ncbi:MAG: hypothetical protein KF805_09120 [Phycisphaeraceae bacterium]|nr:hypothetical protein [Phycisphaeraceae bacterium]
MTDAGREGQTGENADRVAESRRPTWALRWGKRAGVIAFMFFFVKGLAWLVVPVALAAWWSQ